jgi:cytochrome oxidase Cu insertion factor (SCO1/SenC/PrrC family)
VKILLAIILLAGCTDTGRATEILREEGYTRVEITGYEFGCGEDDSTSTGFRAVNLAGNHVHSVVCCGYTGCSKACTVRLK